MSAHRKAFCVEPDIFKPILSEADISHGELQRLIRKELTSRSTGGYVYLHDVFDAYVVYMLEDRGDTNRYFRRDYTVSDTGKVEFGDAVEVSIQTETVPIGESVDTSPETPAFLSGGALIESADNGEGWRWRVQVIQSGISKNRTEYPLPVLHKRAALYEGVPVYYGGHDHDPSHRGFSDVGGWITNPHANERGIEATFEINKGKPDLRETFLHAWDVANRTGRTPFGFSHVIPSGKFKTTVRRLAEGLVRRVDDFTAVDSVDIVMRPSAGGELIGLVAAVDGNQERALTMYEELLQRVRAGEKLAEADVAKLKAEAADAYIDALQEARTVSPTVSQPDSDGELTEAERRFEERVRLAECRVLLSETLAESKLPDVVKDAIREDFTGRVFTADDLEKRIKRDRDAAAKIAEAAGAGMPHAGNPEITADELDKKQKALDGLFEGRAVDGVTPYQSLKVAFKDITGNTEEYISSNLTRMIIAESQGYTPEHWGLRESVNSGSWDQMLGDSITRRMIREYNHPNFQSWRALVTDSVPLNDFRTQRRMRMGGYGNLPGVSEGGTYQPLVSPTDEEATYAPSKRGGLEDITMETIANDDVGAVRRIPVKLGRAAARTIYDAVWNGIIAGNATCTYDSQPLFDQSAHGNSGTTAFSAAALLIVENLMRDQTPYNESAHVLGAGNMPKILAIPNELREIAFRLTQSSVMSQTSSYNATEPNIFANAGYQIIVVDDWTNDKDWYAFADPQNTPFLEVGFLNGREEPELFVQDQPTVGSNFTADKITYKIRHIWGFGILDHRGAYRMDV